MLTKEKYDLLVKLVVIGDKGVGKSSLVNRQFDGNFYQKGLNDIGIDFKLKNYEVGGLKIRAQLWDTVRRDRFKAYIQPYLKSNNVLNLDCKMVCLCFSLTDRLSFNGLTQWIHDLTKVYGIPKEMIVLVGCKSDMAIEVATDQILVFASKEKMKYFETSSKTGEGVNDLFSILIEDECEKQKQLRRNMTNNEEQIQKHSLNSRMKQERKGCCR